ncbi:MAG: Ankyrin repeats (3 copies) [Lentisphaerae bacterium ADurb.BinA184]|nr:MAG: Ankyrin repeats (3 copies) [Lentisphaerae bacterium ADurb.BinA184]
MTAVQATRLFVRLACAAAGLLLVPALAACKPRPAPAAGVRVPQLLKAAFSASELGRMPDPAGMAAADRALYEALREGSLKAALAALEAGASPNLDCGHGCTALMLAAGRGDKPLVAALRRAGAAEPPDAAPYLDVFAFADRAAAPEYQAAIAEAGRLAGQPFAARGERGEFVLELPEAEAQTFVEKHQETLLAMGVFAFIAEMHFAIDGRPDLVACLPTRDKFAVMVYTGVNGVNYDITNHLVLKWMRRLDAQHPYALHGSGADFLSGRFAAAVTNPRVLAEAMYAFCPDMVDQGAGTVEELTADLERRSDFYFWWD